MIPLTAEPTAGLYSMLQHDYSMHQHGRGSMRPPAVSKQKIVELRGKNESVCLDEYYTMVSNFLTLGHGWNFIYLGGCSYNPNIWEI